MRIPFFKYEATGNDFVIIDNRKKEYSFSTEQVKKICDRKFGIGADGLMLLEPHPYLDFNLIYFNSDGTSSLCGNGSRAAVALAASLQIVKGKTQFNAYDGAHEATLLADRTVRLKMNNVQNVKPLPTGVFLNTGSPHFIQIVKDVERFPVNEAGRKIRHSENFRPDGTNANFIQLLHNNTIFVRTYERGVEDETLSCGTGVTAAALAAHLEGYVSPVRVKTLGGELSVEFTANPDGTFANIYLIGPARRVFEGVLEL
ncbi:MAG: diaminopimelate epimerase [Bacteroidetes bacterium]|nr:diaminopimelate epimerase [Bacteroidota bacterium]